MMLKCKLLIKTDKNIWINMEKIIELINQYWQFNENGKPISTLQDKENLLNELEKTRISNLKPWEKLGIPKAVYNEED